MKHIIVPIDFTTHSEKVMDYVFSLASQTRAGILLLHSFFDQIYFSDGGFATGFETNVLVTDEIIGDFYEQRKQNMAEAKNKMEDRIRKAGLDLTVEARIESGDPEYQILEVIKSVKPFLVIMGSKGMGKKGILAGSVSRKVMNHSKCPVIAVPETEYTGPVKNVAYMTDFDEDDGQAIKKLFHLFDPHRPLVYCIHLQHNKDSDLCKRKMNELVGSEEMGELRGRLFGESLKGDDVQKDINEFTRRHDINLIAFIPHKRNILKEWFSQDITKRDLFLTHIPILGLH